MKLPTFILKKDKILKHGTLSTSVIPPQTCIEGIVSVIIKHNKKVGQGGQESVSYYMFEMINSPASGNLFRLRKYSDGIVKDIKVISNKNELPNLPFELGFTPELEHKVVVTSNGTQLTILVSVNRSNFVKIFYINDVDIKEGGIGIGTCKCKARFTEISLRPPKLTLSEEDKKLIMNETSSEIVTPKGNWEQESSKQDGSSFSESSTSNEESSSSSGSSSGSSGSSSSLNERTAEVASANESFNASSTTTSTSESTEIEEYNHLTTSSSRFDETSGVQIHQREDGRIEVRGWTDEGYSSIQSNVKIFSKEYVAGWETCVLTKTSNERKDYCDKMKSDPMRANCQSSFCTSCCESNISNTRINVIHQCMKLCYQSTSSRNDIDAADHCTNNITNQNVFTYCENSMSGKSEGFINKCKLDMCNLCCATIDAQLNIKTSAKSEKNCFNKCSLSKFFYFLINIFFSKILEFNKEDDPLKGVR